MIKYASMPQLKLIEAFGGTPIRIMTQKQAWRYIYQLQNIGTAPSLLKR